MIMVGEELPCFPLRPVTDFLLLWLFNNFLALKKRVCPETFHCVEIFFIFQDFWATCACPEKQSVPWIHCIEYIFLIIQNFEQHALALKNRVYPEIFHCVEIFFNFQDSWGTLRLPWKQSLSWNFLLYLIYFLHSGCLNNLRLPWKQRFPWNFLLYWI